MNRLIARQVHPYHLVDVSPWPFLMAFSLFSGAIGLVSFLGNYPTNALYFLPAMLLIPFQWWRDVVREAKGGYHTTTVQTSILIGFLLFVISEVMVFASVFWAFFHSSLAPAIELGAQWPPVGITAIDPWSLPLLGTCILLASGFILTHSHHAIVAGLRDQSLISLFLTILLGTAFMVIQYTEYNYSEYTIADSVFGNAFFALTGLHGLHVIVGVLFLIVCFWRLYTDQYTISHHRGYEFAILYFHFVDIVWLLVFIVVYWWGGQ